MAFLDIQEVTSGFSRFVDLLTGVLGSGELGSSKYSLDLSFAFLNSLTKPESLPMDFWTSGEDVEGRVAFTEGDVEEEVEGCGVSGNLDKFSSSNRTPSLLKYSVKIDDILVNSV